MLPKINKNAIRPKEVKRRNAKTQSIQRLIESFNNDEIGMRTLIQKLKELDCDSVEIKRITLTLLDDIVDEL